MIRFEIDESVCPTDRDILYLAKRIPGKSVRSTVLPDVASVRQQLGGPVACGNRTARNFPILKQIPRTDYTVHHPPV